jgi:bis(5'-nucleosyl)-tetraphosphatase (symmetrical)
VPQWTLALTLTLAREVEAALRRDPRTLFDHMYGNEPDLWSDALTGTDRLRFAINVLTRLRVCTLDGRVDLAVKGEPPPPPAPLRPWFEIPGRRTSEVRIIFGHWSALGLTLRPGIAGLDSGCVWGGALTALDLDSEHPPVSVPCSGYRRPGPNA